MACITHPIRVSVVVLFVVYNAFYNLLKYIGLVTPKRGLYTMETIIVRSRQVAMSTTLCRGATLDNQNISRFEQLKPVWSLNLLGSIWPSGLMGFRRAPGFSDIRLDLC